jgi:transcriptional regulator of acetoin/glycerol metabolism
MAEAGNEVDDPGVVIDLDVPYSQARAQMLRGFDHAYLRALMQATGGNLSAAARRSGIDRSNLRRLLRQLGLGRAPS